MVIGVTDLIPGVSGGTIALLLGIYQSLVASINGLLTKDWKKSILFLLPIGLGIGIALITVSRLIEWLLVEHPQPTFFFFLGLIIGIIPTLLKDINYKQSFRSSHYVLLALAAVLVAVTVFVKDNELAAVMSELTLGDYTLLFFAGWLASSAMILPGVSGSFMLLLLGMYPTVINALSTFNIPVIITVGLGVAIGLILTSKLISFLLTTYKTSTYAVMIGFVIGSMVVIYPGIASNGLLLFVSILTFLVGIVVATLLSRVEKGKTSAKLIA
ncbi:DUF368 domain-containing protein [Halalkalibacter nanhaiisediminis]|nr:DUF368 domain-containing protein [Halalkalibacter nanhaiisediminis]